MAPLLTVIITAYNFAPYIRQCLDSVLAVLPGSQTAEASVVVVDDGSTDDTLAILAAYAGRPDVTVIHTANQGVSAARNTGLAAATGQYIAFLDGDDYWHENVSWPEIRQRLLQNADIVEFAYHCESPCGQRTAVLHPARQTEQCLPLDESVLHLRIRQFNWYLWCRMYRARLWQGVVFPPGRVYEDIRVLPQVYQQAGSLLTTSMPLVCYRCNPYSITRAANPAHVFDLLEHALWYAGQARCRRDVNARMARGLYGLSVRLASRLPDDVLHTFFNDRLPEFKHRRRGLQPLLCLGEWRFARYFLFPERIMLNLRRVKKRRAFGPASTVQQP